MSSNRLSPAPPGEGETDGQSRRPPDLRRVSIIVPTYRRRASLVRCLEGVFACDVEGLDVEVLVVDDGSDDGTEEAVRGLQTQHRGPVRLHYHRKPHQGSAGATRNVGIAHARGEIIAFIDDDCVPEPGWLKGLLGGPWGPDVGAVGGRIISPASRNWVQRYCRYLRYNEFPPPGPIEWVDTANSAYPADLLRRLGGLEPLVSGGGDSHDLSHRIGLLGYRIRYTPDAVVRHYHRETFRALVRFFYRQGYRGTLRRKLDDTEHAPTLWRTIRKAARCFRRILRVFLIPFQVVDLVRHGTPLRDAPGFAFLNWLRAVVRSYGETVLYWHAVRGRQLLSRTRPLVPEADLSATPFQGEGEARSSTPRAAGSRR